MPIFIYMDEYFLQYAPKRACFVQTFKGHIVPYLLDVLYYQTNLHIHEYSLEYKKYSLFYINLLDIMDIFNR